jgi:pyruvate/2-oxoglutarate dehydrogenase complex dihydrolipoamide dehydrogenase (E3) component
MTEQVDVVVIGMGVGGEEVAGAVAEAGLDVVGVDAGLLGGECPYWGCIPSKMMIRAANLLAEARRVPGMAGQVAVRPDWSPVAARIREEATDNWDDRVAVERFEGKGGRFVRGRARLAGHGRVVVQAQEGEREFEVRRAVVVATGSQPIIPPVPGLADVPYWTNHHFIEAERLPRSLIVLGGGGIGVELAQVAARFGTEVTVVEAGERLIALEEPEASELVANVFAAEGMRVRTGAAAASVALATGGAITVTLANGSSVVGERLLVATGRRPILGDLGLETVGLDPGAKAIEVDGELRAASDLWAVGDVTGHGVFTHVAVYQGRIAAAAILGRPLTPAEYHALPRVTFTDPEIGAVGATEAAARRAGVNVRTGFAPLEVTSRGWIHKVGNQGFIKLVADRDRGVLVGATSAGPVGGEVLSLLALAVHAAVPVVRLRTMIYAFPAFHRGMEDALRDLGDV